MLGMAAQGKRMETQKKREEKGGMPMQYTRTLMFYQTEGESYISAYCNAFDVRYLVLKLGRNVQIGGSDTLIHGAMVLGVPRAGSYRFVDRDRVVCVIITDSGIEATVDRWPGFEFETVEGQVNFGYVMVGSAKQMIEVKSGIGRGVVAPYTTQLAASGQIELPGFEPLEDEAEFRELRETLKSERIARDSNVTMALRRKELDEGAARMHGLRVAMMTRVQGGRRIEEDETEERPVRKAEKGKKAQEQRQHAAFREAKGSWAEQVEEEEEEVRKPVPKGRRVVQKMCGTEAYLELIRSIDEMDQFGKDVYLAVPQPTMEFDSIAQEITYDTMDDVPIFDVSREKMNAKMVRHGASNRGVVTRSGGELYLLPLGLEQ